MMNEPHYSIEWNWVYGENDEHEILHYLSEHDWEQDDVIGEGTTACGLTGFWSIPGIFSRMSNARCDDCCVELGVPHGIGSPKNDDRLRSFVQGRVMPKSLHEGGGL